MRGDAGRAAHGGRAVVQLLAMFGLDERGALRVGRPVRAELESASTGIIERLREPGAIGLITGPSGSGKSTLAACVRARLRSAGERVIEHARAQAWLSAHDDWPVCRAIADGAHLTSPMNPEGFGLLASAGLAEAALLVRPVRALSVGERFRLATARCLAHAIKGSPNALVLIDEFTSGLDRVTARGVSVALARFARRTGVRLLCVTGMDDVALSLKPAVIATIDGAGRVRVDAPESAWADPEWLIAPGTRADLDALAHLHYQAGPPATIAGVWTARDSACPRAGVVGVLVASYPTLHGAWRRAAWPEMPTGREASAAWLNREVRCLSRLIVDRRYRGCGVGSALVRAYVRAPLTPRTEAVATMGAVCPVFASAGMRAVQVDVPSASQVSTDPRSDVRALAGAVGVSGDAHVDARAWRRVLEDASAEAACRRWARSSARTRRQADLPRGQLARVLARACALHGLTRVWVSG